MRMIQAVLDDLNLYTFRELGNGKRTIVAQPLSSTFFNVGDIVELCRSFRIESVWIKPGSILSRQAKPWFFSKANPELYRVWYAAENPQEDSIYTVKFRDEPDSDYISYASARRHKIGGRFEADINIQYPEWGIWCEDGKGQHWETPTARDLLATVLYLQDAFDENIYCSPGNTGKRLMKNLSRERLAERVETSEIPFSEMTMDYLWIRQATADEKKMKYLHQYDKNRQYTGAAQSVRVGTGSPVHVDGVAYHKDSVGIWRVSLQPGASPFNNSTLPCPINLQRPWASTDLIEASRAVGIDVSIHEGWLWRESAKTLDKWAKHMWESSVALRDDSSRFSHSLARQNAFRTSKLMTNATIGRLNREYSQELYRPDINRLIIQRARANMTYSLEKYRKAGYTPAHVYRDALYFFSNESDPRQAVPGILDHEQELRGYKWEYTYEVTPDVLAATATSAAKGHGILKRIEGMK